jgi:hypothetical protein
MYANAQILLMQHKANIAWLRLLRPAQSAGAHNAINRDRYAQAIPIRVGALKHKAIPIKRRVTQHGGHPPIGRCSTVRVVPVKRLLGFCRDEFRQRCHN